MLNALRILAWMSAMLLFSSSRLLAQNQVTWTDIGPRLHPVARAVFGDREIVQKMSGIQLTGKARFHTVVWQHQSGGDWVWILFKYPDGRPTYRCIAAVVKTKEEGATSSLTAEIAFVHSRVFDAELTPDGEVREISPKTK